MKTKLVRLALLLATLAALPLVQGCYDHNNIGNAWVPADLQGIFVVAGGGTAAAGGSSGSGGGYIP